MGFKSQAIASDLQSLLTNMLSSLHADFHFLIYQHETKLLFYLDFSKE